MKTGFVFHLFQSAAEDSSQTSGFTSGECEKLRRLTVTEMHRLSELSERSGIAEIKIDHKKLERVLERFEATKQEEEAQDELIQLGAPSEMMHALFGMNGHEYAGRRRNLKLTRVGRPSIPTEAEQKRIYETYQRYAGLDEVQKWIKIGRELQHSLTTVWHLIKTWNSISIPTRIPERINMHRKCA